MLLRNAGLGGQAAICYSTHRDPLACHHPHASYHLLKCRQKDKGKANVRGDAGRRHGGKDDDEELDADASATGSCRLDQQPSCVEGEMRDYQVRSS